MFLRGVAVCSVLALAAVAQGGVAVQLVPNPNQAFYAQNQVVQVDVKLAQAPGGSDQLLRMVEFDLSLTNSFLTVVLPTTHDMGAGTGDDVHFWSFTSLSTCANLPSVCGFLHFIDDKMAAGPVDTRLNILSIAYRALTADAQYQILLPANGTPVTVGKLQVTMPGLDGEYTLNLVNAAATGADQGVRVDFGLNPHMIWRARLASPNEVSGGTLRFNVGQTGACCVNGNTCNTGVTQAACSGVYQGDGSTSCVNCPVQTQCNLTASDPACGVSWPRSANNFARLTFDKDLVLPAAGQVQIRELLAAGAFGADLSGSFTFSIVNNGSGQPRILRIVENGTVLTDRKWYAITNNGWVGVAAFKVDIVHLIGDADGNGRTLGADASLINSQISPLLQPDKRTDIDGNGRVLGADFSLANSKISPLAVTKPTGHTCSP